MNYSDYNITVEELEAFDPTNPTGKILKIWENIIERIKDTSLQAEAKEKGFRLVNNPDIEEDDVAKYLKIEVPEATEALEEYLEIETYPYIVCLKL